MQVDLAPFDGSCAVVGDVSEFWIDNIIDTSAYKLCLYVAGTVQWVTK